MSRKTDSTTAVLTIEEVIDKEDIFTTSIIRTQQASPNQGVTTTLTPTHLTTTDFQAYRHPHPRGGWPP
jgi:hypothetical protein